MICEEWLTLLPHWEAEIVPNSRIQYCIFLCLSYKAPRWPTLEWAAQCALRESYWMCFLKKKNCAWFMFLLSIILRTAFVSHPKKIVTKLSGCFVGGGGWNKSLAFVFISAGKHVLRYYCSSYKPRQRTN